MAKKHSKSQGTRRNPKESSKRPVTYPQPFSFDSTASYWRCFESEKVAFSCDSSDIPDPNEGIMGLIVLSVTDRGGGHDYLARRPWPIDDCRKFGKTFSAMANGTKHICISGSSAKEELDEHGNKSTIWIFEKYKTGNGCESYFEGDCDLAHQIKKGCKVVQGR